MVEELGKRGIQTTYIAEPDSIRISFSVRNNENDIDKLVEELRDISSKEPKILK